MAQEFNAGISEWDVASAKDAANCSSSNYSKHIRDAFDAMPIEAQRAACVIYSAYVLLHVRRLRQIEDLRGARTLDEAPLAVLLKLDLLQLVGKVGHEVDPHLE